MRMHSPSEPRAGELRMDEMIWWRDLRLMKTGTEPTSSHPLVVKSYQHGKKKLFSRLSHLTWAGDLAWIDPMSKTTRW